MGGFCRRKAREHMIIPVSDVHLGIGLAISVLSIPLILRWIPMNHVYGIRLPRAFVSTDNWYALNVYGGKWLLYYGLFLIAVGVLGRGAAPPPTSVWAPVFLVVPLLAIIPVLVRINAFARRLPDR